MRATPLFGSLLSATLGEKAEAVRRAYLGTDTEGKLAGLSSPATTSAQAQDNGVAHPNSHRIYEG